jgi:predicted DNA binding CopG/RHH family protein
MKKPKLDAFEQAIEDQAEQYRPLPPARQAVVDSILESARKSKNVNLRISEHDLGMLKERSSKEGLPYQTLMASVIHKYVTNQLVDEQNILKSLKLLHS